MQIANRNLALRTEFSSYTEAVNHIHDSLRAENYSLIAPYEWPHLDQFVPMRRVFSLDIEHDLVVYLYRSVSHYEMFAKIKETTV